MSIKYYVLGGPRYKPPEVSRGSPRLHFILMCMLMQLFVCCDRNKVQFNSKNSIQFNSIQKTLMCNVFVCFRRDRVSCVDDWVWVAILRAV